MSSFMLWLIISTVDIIIFFGGVVAVPSIKQGEERVENIGKILAHLRTNGPKSRRQLSDELVLSWGCVSELSSILISRNILLEVEPIEVKAKGRKPSVLTLNPNVCFLGVDINIQGLSGCVCNLLGEKIYHTSTEISYASKEDFIAFVISFVNEIIEKRTNIYGIGIAMQGILNKKANVWEFPLKNKIYINFDLDFGAAFNLPFFVEHDPNCILYGYFDEVSGNEMILRLDSGIGAAVCKNGEFLSDELLEIGYLVINDKGERLHDVLSINKIKSISSKEELVKYLNYAGGCLGLALGNICNLFRLDKIYLCGETVTEYDLLNADFFNIYNQTAIKSQTAKIIPAEVINAAFGAAKLAVDKFKYYF